jgi:hypothetical protein
MSIITMHGQMLIVFESFFLLKIFLSAASLPGICAKSKNENAGWYFPLTVINVSHFALQAGLTEARILIR